MTAQYRATDGPRQGRAWVWGRRLYRVWIAAVPAIAVIAALIAVLEVQDQVDQIAAIQQDQLAEQQERRDQTCLAFERDAQAGVDAYREARRAYNRSLEFLDSVPPAEADNFIVRILRQSLPRLRAEVHQRYDQAKASAAPSYCDDPQVGLDEPNPFLPNMVFP